MKHLMTCTLCLGAGSLLLTLGLAAQDMSGDVALDEAMLEADWTSGATLTSMLGEADGLRTQGDAAGVCDGIKDGGYGCHTDGGPQAWWQVDLGGSIELSRVLVFNRCDPGVAKRAAELALLVSTDGSSWTEAYRHDGSVFYGQTDGKPLSIDVGGRVARFVRVQLPGGGFLHLDEVEVYAVDDPDRNIAFEQPADQSGVSQWSTVSRTGRGSWRQALDVTLTRGAEIAARLELSSAASGDSRAELEHIAESLDRASDAECRDLYLRARGIVRELCLSDPVLDFDDLLFTKRAPGTFTHMSDQYYGWWSRPGGGVCILRDFKSDSPELVELTSAMPEGSFLRPDLSFDGKKVLFAYARFHEGLRDERDKVAKEQLPEDGFYHIFEMNVDGSDLRQLTHGRYDDFDARYLPDGEIVFLSTRRGQFFQCGSESAEATRTATLPDSYVRCGGDAYRPVAIYTLHVMDRHGEEMRQISPFEMFEWTPTVAHDGTILYSRWDYVDRDNMPYMGLWSTNPDGTNARIVFGNHVRNPHAMFEARSIPGSEKIVFTASGHHSITAGSLVLLDPSRGSEDPGALTRLTPEVCFPETEGWPTTYYANPWPLSEESYLVAWSELPLASQGRMNPVNAMGIYLFDATGHRELVYRDPAISSMYPIPVRPRPQPPALASTVDWDGPQEGNFLVQDVYRGLDAVERGSIKELRLVGVPVKTQPEMNQPALGVTRDDPGKCVLGTVPVEEDGSAWFRAPSGVTLFLQALDERGFAVQTMRTATHVQPGQTASCIGCHEADRSSPPPAVPPMATRRAPSRIRVGPDGSWPIRFDRLVQPLLTRNCVECHDTGADTLDLSSPDAAYGELVDYGSPSLRDQVMRRYNEGASTAGGCVASNSKLLELLLAEGGHHGVELEDTELERLTTWMDTYAQRGGAFSDEQELRLRALRTEWVDLLIERQ